MSEPTTRRTFPDWLRSLSLFQLPIWTPAAVTAWGILIISMIVRTLMHPDRATNMSRFLRTGVRWLEGEKLYSYVQNKGFVYSPFAAVCYAITTWVPKVVGIITWHLISIGLILGGLLSMLKWGPYTHIPARSRGLVCLLVFPLALGNLDSAQANPLVIGCIMIAIAAAYTDRWWIAALAIGLATHWKVYPLAVGLLLILLSPWKFTWRLVLVLAVMALIPFLFQSSSYVIDQYQLWFDSRSKDNRFTYPMAIAPIDTWFVLKYMLHIPMNETAYRLAQVATGGLVAVYCLYGRWRSWSKERLYAGMFTFVTVWMVLLGPASEMHTYFLAAPAAAFALVESFSGRLRPACRIFAALAYLFLILGILRVGFVPHVKIVYLLAFQPLGALFLLGYALTRYLDNTGWEKAEENKV